METSLPDLLEAILDQWHIGVVVFAPDGRQLLTNAAAARIAAAQDGFSLGSRGPRAATALETRELREALRTLAEGQEDRAWLRLRRPSGARSYELALQRVKSSDTVAVIIFITESDASPAIDLPALRKLHRLTDLEARVAVCLGQGQQVRDIAPALGLSVETARWYVQQVRLKLDAATQADAVRLLIGSVTTLQHKREAPLAATN